MPCEGCTLFSARDSIVYQKLLNEGQTEISDACLISRVAWNGGFQYQKLLAGGCLCLISDGGVFTDPHMTWPVGKISAPSLKTMIDTAWQVFERQDWPMRIMYIDEAFLPLIRQVDGYSARITHNADFDDYVYEAESLRRLSGKTLHGQRNQFNRFARLYPGYAYRPIAKSDATEALALVKAWCEERGLDCCDYTQSDFKAICQVFDDYDTLEIRGGTIRVGGALAAFAIGSLLRGETAVIHFEKASTGYEGLYAAINKIVLGCEFPCVREVNREEDMGIEGLRKAKESYNPIRKIRKYEAWLSKTGG